MLDTFYGTLPGVKPQQYSRSDTTTFNKIYAVAVNLSLYCVKRMLEPEAGWSFAGKAATSSAYRLCKLGHVQRLWLIFIPLTRSEEQRWSSHTPKRLGPRQSSTQQLTYDHIDQ